MCRFARESPGLKFGPPYAEPLHFCNFFLYPNSGKQQNKNKKLKQRKVQILKKFVNPDIRPAMDCGTSI